MVWRCHLCAKECLLVTVVFLLVARAVQNEEHSPGLDMDKVFIEDDAYNPDIDLEGLEAFFKEKKAMLQEAEAEVLDMPEVTLTKEDLRIHERAANLTQTALMKVFALSWPSEGKFGRKVGSSLPPEKGIEYDWARAKRKAFRILADVDSRTQDAPSEEVMLALGYRHLHGVGTRPDCAQALFYYNSVADSVARYMEEKGDSKELKLDLGLMRISLSEVDGILGEILAEDEAALEYDRLNAQAGDHWAQKELGWRSLVGKGVDQDHEHAHANLEAAAVVGDAEAMHNLGYMHMNGLGVPQNYTKAKEYFDKASEGNITAAFNALGYMYFQGVGAERNLTEAERWLKRASDIGDADAAFNLAALYQELDRNMSRAFPLLDQASENGFWRAHLAIAEAFEHGIDRPRNCTAAVVALKKLVETFGGVARELRDGVELYKQSLFPEARKLFCELAEQGVEVAQSNCAWMTLNGRGTSKTVNQTLRYLGVRQMFALGGQQGGADSHLRLGDMEWYGQGQPSNRSAAIEHYQIAASRRSHQASFIMGTLYQFGIGTRRNLTLARRMYKRSGSNEFAQIPSYMALSLLRAQDFLEKILELTLVGNVQQEGQESQASVTLSSLSLPILAITLAICLMMPIVFELAMHLKSTRAPESDTHARGARHIPNVGDYLN